jgi:hypothetical protein
MEIYMILLLFLVIVVVLAFFLGVGTAKSATDAIPIISGSQPGNRKFSKKIPLPPSYNQPEGLVYSYAGWILIKDFTVGYGTRRTLLTKGDSPGIYIDATSNALLFTVDTFGSTESILISNIPAMKWIHFAMVVDQHSADIFINGTLRQHHTLGQLPKLNDQEIKSEGGWDGVIGNVTYYPYALKPAAIKKLSQEDVPDDMIAEPSVPQYFDITWYIGRLNSI